MAGRQALTLGTAVRARSPEPTLGAELRRARLGLGWSLRGVAREVGISAPYLSDIELDRRVPAAAVLARLAEVLELEPEALVDLTGRLDERTRRWLRGHPTALRLLRRMAEVDLEEDQLGRLLGMLDRMAMVLRRRR